MPRKPRIFLPDIPNHIVQRGKNREPVFFDSEDYEFYLDRLGCAIQTHEARLHAYVLMTNHIHLLMSGEQSNTISLIMQSIGRHYVPYLNRKYNLSGSIWQGRFKSHLVDSGEYFLACMRYIELNPVRAGMVAKPEQYVYSSYQKNALGKQDILVSEHDEYLGLANNKIQRQTVYRSMFDDALDLSIEQAIRQGSRNEKPIGSIQFREKIAKITEHKA